jgi:hypothetical protein
MLRISGAEIRCQSRAQKRPLKGLCGTGGRSFPHRRPSTGMGTYGLGAIVTNAGASPRHLRQEPNGPRDELQPMPIRLTHTEDKSFTTRRIAATCRNTKSDMSRNYRVFRPFSASAAQVAALEWVGRVLAQQFVAFYSPVCVNRIGMLQPQPTLAGAWPPWLLILTEPTARFCLR